MSPPLTLCSFCSTFSVLQEVEAKLTSCNIDFNSTYTIFVFNTIWALLSSDFNVSYNGLSCLSLRIDTVTRTGAMTLYIIVASSGSHSMENKGSRCTLNITLECMAKCHSPACKYKQFCFFQDPGPTIML